MNPAHLHIILNHFPFTAFLIGLGLVIAGIAAGSAVRQAGLAVIFLGALTCIPVFYSGHEAEDVAEKFAAQRIIEEHEQAGEWAYIMTLISGVSAGAAFVSEWKGLRISRYALGAAVVLSLIAGTALARTGWLGGKIRHTEFSDNQVPEIQPLAPEPLVPHRH